MNNPIGISTYHTASTNITTPLQPNITTPLQTNMSSILASRIPPRSKLCSRPMTFDPMRIYEQVNCEIKPNGIWYGSYGEWLDCDVIALERQPVRSCTATVGDFDAYPVCSDTISVASMITPSSESCASTVTFTVASSYDFDSDSCDCDPDHCDDDCRCECHCECISYYTNVQFTVSPYVATSGNTITVIINNRVIHMVRKGNDGSAGWCDYVTTDPEVYVYTYPTDDHCNEDGVIIVVNVPASNDDTITVTFNVDDLNFNKIDGGRCDGFHADAFRVFVNNMVILITTTSDEIVNLEGDALYSMGVPDDVFTSIDAPDSNKILVLDNIEDLIDFDKKYSIVHPYLPVGIINTVPSRSKHLYMCRDWVSVGRDFGGVEVRFNPKDVYCMHRTHPDARDCSWISSWDVRSGVVWQKTVLEKLTVVRVA